MNVFRQENSTYQSTNLIVFFTGQQLFLFIAEYIPKLKSRQGGGGGGAEGKGAAGTSKKKKKKKWRV